MWWRQQEFVVYKIQTTRYAREDIGVAHHTDVANPYRSRFQINYKVAPVWICLHEAKFE